MKSLEQDKLSLLTDLKTVSLQIKDAKKELEQTLAQIVRERELLKKLQDNYSPTEQAHESRIEELAKRIASLEGEKMKLESDIFTLNDSFQKAEQSFQERIALKTQAYSDIVGKVAALESDKWNFERNKNIAEGEYKKAKEKQKEAELYLQELKMVQKEIALKQQVLASLNSELEKFQLREDDINKFAQQLELQEKELAKREKIVAVMENRLTPEYRKVFKHFSNI